MPRTGIPLPCLVVNELALTTTVSANWRFSKAKGSASR